MRLKYVKQQRLDDLQLKSENVVNNVNQMRRWRWAEPLRYRWRVNRRQTLFVCRKPVSESHGVGALRQTGGR